jgi:hypothetical protein
MHIEGKEKRDREPMSSHQKVLFPYLQYFGLFMIIWDYFASHTTKGVILLIS